MIKSAELYNFQRYKKFIVEFDPFVTCFVGDSDAGKSSFMRSLLWACLNEPSGLEMIRFGQNTARVKIVVAEGKVVRKRGKTKYNLYYVNGDRLAAFGMGVPARVSKLLNISHLNFQFQMDVPFWFFETAGKVSRELNSIVDLDVIDSSLSKANAVLKKAISSLEVMQERHKDAKAKVKAMSYVPDANSRFVAMERRHLAFMAKSDKLEELKDKLKLTRLMRDKAQDKARAAGRMEALLKHSEDYIETQRKLKSLLKLIDGLYQTEAIRNRKVLDVEKLDKIIAKKRELISLQKLLAQIKEQEETWQNWKSRSTQIEDTLKEESGTECPACGSPIES